MHSHPHPHAPGPMAANSATLLELNPIVLGSSIQGSGEVLIQRLLNSAPNTLFYGTSAANELVMLAGIYMSRYLHFKKDPNYWNQALEQVLAGGESNYQPDLMPELEEYIEVMPEEYFSIMYHYKDFAERSEREIWGLTMGGWNVGNFNTILPILPNTKFIYLVRDVISTLEAGKAIQLVQSLDDFRNVAGIWNQQVEGIQHFREDSRFLVLTYEELLADPDKWITAFEKFTGAEGIQKAVLEAELERGEPKAELSEAETAILKEMCGEMREKMGYVESRFL